MSDDPVLPELDARAASAATALRAEVAAFDLDLALEPPHRSGHRGWLAAAAVLLAVALVAGAAWLAGGDNGDDVKTIDRPAPLYLYPDHVPDGLRFVGVTDLAATESTDQAFAPAEVYADRDVDEVLLTWTMKPSPGQTQTTAPRGDPIEVRGQKGRIYSEAGFLSISFEEPGGQIIVVGIRGGDRSDVLEIAEGASAEGDHVVVPPDLVPDGLERLGRISLDRLALADFYTGFSGIGTGGGGQAVAWTNDDEKDLRAVAVVVQDATAADEAVLGLFDRDVEHRQVGGHDAVTSRSSQDELDGRAVAWIEDGHLVRVVTMGFSAEDGIAVAESLRRVDVGEFTRLTADVPLPPGVHLVARGKGPDAWLVTVDADGSLCVGRGGDSSCSGSSDGATVTVDSDAAPTVVAGTAPGGTTVEVLDGTRSLLVEEPVEVDGTLYFAATAPEDVTSVDVVITDAAGHEDRQTVSTKQSGTVSRETAATTIPGG